MTMIPFQQAQEILFSKLQSWGNETVPLEDSLKRILAEDVHADRALPPFHRVAMDGIAIQREALEQGITTFHIEGRQFAGAVQTHKTNDLKSCIETATGAVLPGNCDLVIPYEWLEEGEGFFTLTRRSETKQWQNVHLKGSDLAEGSLILHKNTRIDIPAISALASVGVHQVPVKRLPRVAIISTGDELVPPEQMPLPHQIRQSNGLTIASALEGLRINADIIHLEDDVNQMKGWIESAMDRYDVLVFSGGVSMGKRDFLPQLFKEAGVTEHFHRVAQRPGKPLWFGSGPKISVFGLPGNPVSSLATAVFYLRPWLLASLTAEGIATNSSPDQVELSAAVHFSKDLSTFRAAKLVTSQGRQVAIPTEARSSGDYYSLIGSDGFLLLENSSGTLNPGSVVPFYPFEWRKS